MDRSLDDRVESLGSEGGIVTKVEVDQGVGKVLTGGHLTLSRANLAISPGMRLNAVKGVAEVVRQRSAVVTACAPRGSQWPVVAGVRVLACCYAYAGGSPLSAAGYCGEG